LSDDDYQYAQVRLYNRSVAQREAFLRSDRGRRILRDRLIDLYGEPGITILETAERWSLLRKIRTPPKPGLSADQDWDDYVDGPYSNWQRASAPTPIRPTEALELRCALLDARQFFMSLDCLPGPDIAVEVASPKGMLVLSFDRSCDGTYMVVERLDHRGVVEHRASTYAVNSGDGVGLKEALDGILGK
jgi:hypothetical protein